MNNRIKELLRRLLSLKSVVPLLIIIIAFMGTFVTTPFGLERDQILLGLLAFLAIDALIERLEILANIEKDVHELKELAASQTSERDFLRFRWDFRRLEHYIAEARKEIWVSGITLDTIAGHTGIFSTRLEEGFALRFLAVAPEGSAVQEISDYLAENRDDLVGRIRTSLNLLDRRLAQKYPQQVEIRVINQRPTVGYFVVDPDQEQGYTAVSFYLYQLQGSECPLLFLSNKTDSQWCDVYLKDFERLWNHAAKWRT